jgi:serine protease Do
MTRIFTVLLLAISTAAASAQSNAPRRPGAAPAREPSGFKQNPQVISAFKDVVVKPGQSVVRVRSNAKDVALGTIVAADGWVLTKNSELMPGATPYVVLRDGRTLAAKVTGVDNKWDLAMLKIDATDLVPVTWGDAKSAAVGELLAAPGTVATPVAVGVLSVAARAVKPRELPSAQPPASAGFLGVGLDEGDGGARITQLVPNAAAAKAGLKVDDVVTSIADVPIIDSESMVNTIQHHKPGDVVSIRLKRGNEELEIKATLDKRPPPDPGLIRRDFQNNLGSELSNRRGGFPQILQHDLVLKPSDCGGPVVDLDGKALGINIARAGRVESYAIPAEAVRALIPDLQSGKLSPTRESPATKPATTAPTTKPAK